MQIEDYKLIELNNDDEIKRLINDERYVFYGNPINYNGNLYIMLIKPMKHNHNLEHDNLELGLGE